MIKRLAVLSCLLLGVTGSVRAQGCVPSNIPTNVVSGFQVLDPSQVPFAAVTMNLSATSSGAGRWHKGTVGNGTQLNLNWQAYNIGPTSPTNSTLDLYYSLDGGSRTMWSSPGSLGINGTMQIGMQQAWVGHILNLFMVAKEKPGSGASTPTTQDINHITITNQAPGIYYDDGNDRNVYYAISTSYSGIPEVSFADCPAMRTARHTPTGNLQLQNVSSGEIRNTVSVTGPTELAGNTVQASAVDYLSGLPGDSVSGTYGGVTFCDVDNINFFGIQSLFRIEGAKVVVADLGHPPRVGSEKPVPSAIYDVAPICQNNCDPPDWQPTVVHSFVGRHPYWIGECQLLRAPDLDGVPWIPLCSFMTDASEAFGAGLIPSTIQLAAGGLALPYPGPAPLLPIPGKCTKYPINVLFTVGPNDLKNWFENIPN